MRLQAWRLSSDGSDSTSVKTSTTPNTFVLYELYDSAEALDLHHQQPHYQAIAEFRAGLIASRRSTGANVRVAPQHNI